MSKEQSKVRKQDVSVDPLRNAVRFPLHFKVRVQTEHDLIDAETEDVSSTGVLFRMPNALEINTRLSWTMTMPAAALGHAADIVVHCIGRVVWNAPGQGFRLVAVVIDGYRLVEASV